MKPLALLFITGAFALHGTAFFGVWTAPGLEVLPTYADVSGASADEATERPVEDPGIFPVSSMDDWMPWGVTRVGE
ncbi:MAG: hypothetical protein HKN82_05585 [Akkermansiaceae bacterium]|nr:hypothetical protein [Akkermansiaceae bacterium]